MHFGKGQRLRDYCPSLTRLQQYDFVSIALAIGYGDAIRAWHHAPVGIRGVPFTPRFSVRSVESRRRQHGIRRRSCSPGRCVAGIASPGFQPPCAAKPPDREATPPTRTCLPAPPSGPAVPYATATPEN